MVYPIKMKEAVIKKVQKGGKLHHEIASEAGIGRSTLTYWLKNHMTVGLEQVQLGVHQLRTGKYPQPVPLSPHEG